MQLRKPDPVTILQLSKYIHLNPVRAKMVIHPEDYKWSSHKAYLNLNSVEWLTTSYVFEFFSAKRTQAVFCYAQYIRENITGATTEINFITQNQKTFPAICDDLFMKKLELIQNIPIEKSALTLEKIIQYVCIFYQIEEPQLHNKSREHFNAKVRAVIA